RIECTDRNTPWIEAWVSLSRCVEPVSIGIRGFTQSRRKQWTSSWTDRIIGYASSRDLIHWSEQRAIPVMMHEPTAHNCWAPAKIANNYGSRSNVL
ncbi:hypothetical protein PZH42_31545, partial [Bacteroides cellulosilyticus]|nr:hypothetical protein [Bacteroides cellulosilyticus]